MSSAYFKILVATYLCVLLGLGVYIYQYDMKSQFSIVPYYWVGYFFILATAMAVGFIFLRSREMIITPACLFFAAGAVILLVPVFYPRSAWCAEVVGRLALLFGSWIIYFLLLQYRITQRLRAFLLYTLLFTATAGALLLFSVTAEANVGSASMGAGGADVVRSLLASGLLAGWVVMILPRFRSLRRDREQWRILLLSALLVGLSFSVSGGASQTVCFSVLLSAGFFTLLFLRRYPLYCLLALLMTALGFCLALLVDELNLNRHFSHVTLLKPVRDDRLFDLLAMIVEKPWLGWGYGRFEHGFTHLRAHALLPLSTFGGVQPPYNELLLWWAEGGSVALAGIFCLLAGVTVLMREAWRRDAIAYRVQSPSAGEAMSLGLTALPMLFHVKFVYPLGPSSFHWVILTLLLAVLDGQGRAAAVRFTSPTQRGPE
ncbi:O-antigen ligase family protein [Serratia sp. IR-2025]